MPVLLGNKSISDEDREKNNENNNIKIVFYVLGIIFLFIYFFTQFYKYIGIISPENLINLFNPIKNLFNIDNDGNLDTIVQINFTNNFYYTNDDERLIFFIGLITLFLLSYYLKVKYKRFVIAVISIILFFLLFNFKIPIIFFTMHLLMYLLFHNENDKSKYFSFIAGFTLALSFLDIKNSNNLIIDLIILILSTLSFGLIYNKYFIELLKNIKIANIFRTIFVQLTMITVILGLLSSFIFNYTFDIATGLFLFFMQWQRIILYHIDYKDNLIPKDLSFTNYITTLVNPCILVAAVDGHSIGSGYRYTNSNYLIEDKNKIILSGVKILFVSFIYLVFWFKFSLYIQSFLVNLFKVPIFYSIEDLTRYALKENNISTSTVLVSTILYQIRWFLLFGGLVHFKVGLWRILGFRLDPYFDKPWLATNLISFWSRYSFYYREFLVKTFYYPIFLNFFKKNMTLRIFASTFFATCIGNYTWGHIPEILLTKTLETKNLIFILPRWPYYVLLGFGVSLTQIYLLKKKNKRKPWTKDWYFFLDLLFMYFTIQFFSLIHLFARPIPEGSLYISTKLFLIGLGIKI